MMSSVHQKNASFLYQFGLHNVRHNSAKKLSNISFTLNFVENVFISFISIKYCHKRKLISFEKITALFLYSLSKLNLSEFYFFLVIYVVNLHSFAYWIIWSYVKNDNLIGIILKLLFDENCISFLFWSFNNLMQCNNCIM
jgi:hypothetical protein